jgi:hypothetical protein
MFFCFKNHFRKKMYIINMSYVYARDIGCGDPINPFHFMLSGPLANFEAPQTQLQYGRTRGVSAGALNETTQGFYADQVKASGLTPTARAFYHNLTSNSYPGSWIPCCLACSTHTSLNGTLEFYNLGQIYLNNALAWTFLKFNPKVIAYEPTDRNNAASILAPTFTQAGKNTLPTELDSTNLKFLTSKGPHKYSSLLNEALMQAYASQNMYGCCGKTLTFICNQLDARGGRDWVNGGTVLGKWWKSKNPHKHCKVGVQKLLGSHQCPAGENCAPSGKLLGAGVCKPEKCTQGLGPQQDQCPVGSHCAPKHSSLLGSSGQCKPNRYDHIPLTSCPKLCGNGYTGASGNYI